AAAPPAAPRVWVPPPHRCWPGRTRRYPPAADGAAPPGPRADRTRAARRPFRARTSSASAGWWSPSPPGRRAYRGRPPGTGRCRRAPHWPAAPARTAAAGPLPNGMRLPCGPTYSPIHRSTPVPRATLDTFQSPEPVPNVALGDGEAAAEGRRRPHPRRTPWLWYRQRPTTLWLMQSRGRFAGVAVGALLAAVALGGCSLIGLGDEEPLTCQGEAPP